MGDHSLLLYCTIEVNIQSYTHNIDINTSNNMSSNATIIIDISVAEYAIYVSQCNIFPKRSTPLLVEASVQ